MVSTQCESWRGSGRIEEGAKEVWDEEEAHVVNHLHVLYSTYHLANCRFSGRRTVVYHTSGTQLHLGNTVVAESLSRGHARLPACRVLHPRTLGAVPFVNFTYSAEKNSGQLGSSMRLKTSPNNRLCNISLWSSLKQTPK